MKTKIVKTFSRFYKRIFGIDLSGEAETFFQNLLYVFSGYGLFLIIGFVFQIVSGRVLGPDEYGKYALIYSISMFFTVPMLLGFSTALMQRNSKETNLKKQKTNISTAFFTVLLFSILWAVLGIVFSKYIASVLKIELLFVYEAIALAFLSSLNTLVRGALQSLHKMKKASFYYFLQGLVLILALIILLLLKNHSHQAATISLGLGYLLSFLPIVITLRKYLKPVFEREVFKVMLKYALAGVLGGLATTVLSQVASLIINHQLNVTNVGIYNAYYSSSILIGGSISAMFMVVFFPTASKIEDKSIIYEKVAKIIPYLYVVGFVIMVAVSFVVLKLYGSNYPINLGLLLLFALAAVLSFHYSIYAWTFASEGIRGNFRSTLITIIIAAVIVALNLIFVKHYLLYGIAISVIISYLLGIIISLVVIKQKQNF